MQIAIIENNEVIQVGDYRKLFPYTVFPDSGPTDGWLLDNSCKRVNLFKPHDSLTEVLVSCPPYIEGEWVYTVMVRAKTEEEIQSALDSMAAQIRTDRNGKLAATDWTQLKDIPDSVSSEWAVYRQALRDIPNQEGFPTSVVWPVSPDAVDNDAIE